MNPRITVRGIEHSVRLRELAAIRISSALQRFAGRVQGVVVLLEDLTGPRKQSVDKHCRIGVRLRPTGVVTIDEVGTDIHVALAAALDRLKCAVGRAVGRRKRGVGAG